MARSARRLAALGSHLLRGAASSASAEAAPHPSAHPLDPVDPPPPDAAAPLGQPPHPDMAAVPDEERAATLFADRSSPARADEAPVSGLAAATSDEAIARYHRTGWLVVEDAFSAEAIAAALAGVSAIARRENPDFCAAMDAPYRPPAETGDAEEWELFYENRESMIYPETVGNSRDQPEFLVEGGHRPVRKVNGFVQFDERLAAVADGLREAAAALLRRRGAAGTRGQEEAEWEAGAVLFQDMALLKPERVGGEKPWHQVRSCYGCYGLSASSANSTWPSGPRLLHGRAEHRGRGLLVRKRVSRARGEGELT